MDVKPQSKKGGDVASRLLQKMLMPIVAGAASAAATYVAKKGPQLLDDKVVPKVRELLDGAGGAARLTERARSVAGGVVGTDGHHGGDVSPKELEDRLRRRAKSRAARRKATR